MNRILTGLRVIDFCWVGAGALVTQALAVYGAEVIKIESSVHLDNLRLSGPFRDDRQSVNGSGYFASRNSNKKSFALNMAEPRGQELAMQLVAAGSMVTSNFRPGVMEKWGLGYEAVRAVNPSVIYLTMPMQGVTGPRRDFVGFGSTIAAASGLVHPSGLPGRTPIGTGTHFPDHVPNPGHALVAVLAALYRRRRTGQGARIELSQLESTVNVVGPMILAASLGAEAVPRGNRDTAAVPHGVFPCAGDDIWCALSVPDDSVWAAFVKALGRAGAPGRDDRAGLPGSALLAEARYRTASGRRGDERALEVALGTTTRELPREVLLRVCHAVGVAAAPVNSPEDLLKDPNLVARGFWRSFDHPDMGTYRVGSMPFHAGRSSGHPTGRAPMLGEHTEELARDLLGLGADEVAALRDAGVLV